MSAETELAQMLADMPPPEGGESADYDMSEEAKAQRKQAMQERGDENRLRQRAARDALKQLDLPEHIARSSNNPESDWHLLCTYGNDLMAALGDKVLAVCDRNGYWNEVQTTAQGVASLGVLLADVRQQAQRKLDQWQAAHPELDHVEVGNYVDELIKSWRVSGNHLREMALLSPTMLEQHPDIRRIPGGIFAVAPAVLPLDDGRTLDLTANRELSPADLRPRYIKAFPQRLPATHWRPQKTSFDTIPPGARAMHRWIKRTVGWGLIQQLGRRLRQPSKGIDTICVRQSNAGKSTLIEAVCRALPGMADVDSESKGLKGGRFTPIPTALSEYRLVFADEVDKLDDDIPEGMLNGWTANTLTIEKKGVNQQRVPRQGTLILVGADWPPINCAGQGVKKRLTWAYEREWPEMSQEQRQAILHPDGIAWLATMLIIAARDDRPANPNDAAAAAAAVNQFHAERTPDGIQAITEAFHEQRNAFTPTQAIKDAIVAAGDDPPAGRGMSKLVKATFPFARSARRQKQRGWLHLAPIPETSKNECVT